MRVTAVLFCAVFLTGCGSFDREVANPHPVRLVRPRVAPLSAVAQLGKALFYDSSLSASGSRSCSSCHQPDHAYAAADRSAMMLVAQQSRVPSTEGREQRHFGQVVRAIPSLRYSYRSPNFSIGPELDDADDAAAGSQAATTAPTGGSPKVAGGSSRSDLQTARGGLFWDGRVNTLQDQAMGPLFNANEMGNASVQEVAKKLERAPYARQFVTLFGVRIFAEPARLVDEAMFAIARYQIEDESFHPYNSKFDRYLEGKAKLTRDEWRGLQAFEDPKRGNCAACHVDRPRGDGLPPVFTDYEYAALAVPRDTTLRTVPGTDLGACGPSRTDLAEEPSFCGKFRTPSLRNTATRSEFFHNGVYSTLEQVLAFYNFRDTRPERVYLTHNGHVVMFDDLPARYRHNIDTTDAPFVRHRGDKPPMSDRDMQDIIAFLKTLTDSM